MSMVTTDLAAMLGRPAQRELDLAAGSALGLSPAAVKRERLELLRVSAERLERAAQLVFDPAPCVGIAVHGFEPRQLGLDDAALARVEVAVGFGRAV